MNERDIIIVDFPSDLYGEIVNQQIKYAIISLPFTIDRMKQIERYGSRQGNLNRIKNIFKGKIAEGLFSKFAELNNINIDFDQCSTPFYQVDNRDFLYGNTEFDLKNNFIFHNGDEYDNYSYLPAMIPNRFGGDQWSSRLNNHIGNEVAYLFSFMKGAPLNNGQRGAEFVSLNLTQAQGDFLNDLYVRFGGQPQENQPFAEDWFWDEMEKLGNLNFFNLNDRPKLVICGIGNRNNWDSFSDIGPYSLLNSNTHPINNWCRKVGMKNNVVFLNGVIWSTITNRTSSIQNLIPFSEVFTNLNTQNLRHARFKE